MERSRLTIVIWLVVAGFAVLVGMRLFGDRGAGGGEPVRLDAGGTAAAPRGRGSAGPAPARATAIVHVAGAVRAPGLYRLAPDARVAAAVERAGGPSRHADLGAVNLAARVQDGQQIVVPGAAARSATPAGATAGVKPSLGSASVEELEELDGIGPTLAQRIVEYRQQQGGFRSVDDLAEVEGIGEKRLASLRDALQP